MRAGSVPFFSSFAYETRRFSKRGLGYVTETHARNSRKKRTQNGCFVLKPQFPSRGEHGRRSPAVRGSRQHSAAFRRISRRPGCAKHFSVCRFLSENRVCWPRQAWDRLTASRQYKPKGTFSYLAGPGQLSSPASELHLVFAAGIQLPGEAPMDRAGQGWSAYWTATVGAPCPLDALSAPAQVRSKRRTTQTDFSQCTC